MSQESKIAEIRVNKYTANLVGILLMILSCALGVGFARLLPHYVAFAEWHVFALMLSVIVLLPVHEALHAVGAVRFAGVSWRHIRFGVMWRVLTPYCQCMVPISMRAFRRASLLPLYVTGPIIVTALLFYPTDWFGAFAGIALAGCVGDLWVYAKMRRFSADLIVLDSPSEMGCDIYSEIPQVDEVEIRKPHVATIVLICLLFASLLCSVALNVWGFWQFYCPGGWRDVVYNLGERVASRRALDDFRDGHFRLFQLGGKSEKAKYTGTNDGPFEAWILQFDPSLGCAYRYSTEQYIEFYNWKMRYLSRTNRFGKEPEGIPSNAAATGSQPIRSETNRTSPAAGSHT